MSDPSATRRMTDYLLDNYIQEFVIFHTRFKRIQPDLYVIISVTIRVCWTFLVVCHFEWFSQFTSFYSSDVKKSKIILRLIFF